MIINEVAAPVCPDCAAQSRLIGPIQAAGAFAGRKLNQPLAGGYLYRCNDCLLGFRWPQLPKEQLDVLYEQGNERAWSATYTQRADWSQARDWIMDALRPGSTILDIGCFDGGFLEPLVSIYRCHGIEIQLGARRRSEEKGIQLIGNDFAKIEGEFDCITAFDVIEHVQRPREFLVNCLAALRPGGYLVIATGNLDSRTFRFMGSRYGYCTFAEHLSFLSPRWLVGPAITFSYKIENMMVFAHSNPPLGSRIKGAVASLLYRVSPDLFGLLRRFGLGGIDTKLHPELAGTSPGWPGAKDHFMILLRKS